MPISSHSFESLDTTDSYGANSSMNEVEQAVDMTWELGVPDFVTTHCVISDGKFVDDRNVEVKISTAELFHRKTKQQLHAKDITHEGCQSFRRKIFEAFPEKSLDMAKEYVRIASKSPQGYIKANRRLLAWKKRLLKRSTR
jgi:hypothetical protein